MAMSDHKRRERIAATRETAQHFVEDMAYLKRETSVTDPDKADIRRMSNVLRRLLIAEGGDINAISRPRLARPLLLHAPAMNWYIRRSEKHPWNFCNGISVEIFGVVVGTMTAGRANQPLSPPNFNPEEMTLLSVDDFLGQKTMCLKGRWATRRLLLKYIANIGGGVHSGKPTDDEEQFIADLTISGHMQVDGDVPAFAINEKLFGTGQGEYKTDKHSVNFVLVQLFATAKYIVTSPDIVELIQIVERENA
jgi:hypothetical protein